VRLLFVQQFWLAATILAVSLSLGFPIASRFGEAGVAGLVAAAFICLAPGCVVLLIPALMQQSRLVGLTAMVAGVLRMMAVLAGLVAVVVLRPDIPPMVFGGCLVVLYLVSLGVETWFIVRSLRVSAKTSDVTLSG